MNHNHGAVGFGWREFMEKVKPEVSRIMRDNRQTKIKMILSCKMVREYENGSVQLQDSFFHTKVIENLRATDESQAFAKFSIQRESRFDTCNTCFELYTRATCTTHVPSGNYRDVSS